MRKKSILYVGNALSSKGKTVTHIDTLSTLLRAEGYRIVTTSSYLNKGVRLLDMIYTLISVRNTTDFVLIDTYSTTNFWYAVIVSKFCRLFHIPYIPILHGGNLPARLKSHKKHCDTLFKNALVNVAPSDYLFNTFAKAGYKNLKLIPNTIQIDQYPFVHRPSVTPTLLWVRAFAEIYNPSLALDIVQNLLKFYPHTRLVMVGPEKDGSLQVCKTRALKEGLPIRFTGKLSKSQWISLAQECDIFINTTNFDNTPVSIIEAMALGLPIVSTNVGGLPFLIQEGRTGILTSPGNVKDFTNKILKLIEEKDKASELSSQGRLKAENFDWSQVKGLWEEVLS